MADRAEENRREPTTKGTMQEEVKQAMEKHTSNKRNSAMGAMENTMEQNKKDTTIYMMVIETHGKPPRSVLSISISRGMPGQICPRQPLHAQIHISPTRTQIRGQQSCFEKARSDKEDKSTY